MIPYRVLIAPRLAVSHRLSLLVQISAILTGLVVCALFLIAVGVPPEALWSEFLVFTFGNVAGLDQTLTRATPLILVGLSVSMGLRVKFWNIGVEGQLWVGAVAATAVVLYGSGSVPVHLPMMLIAAAILGGVWCLVCALGRLYLRADEVITTLLMNYIGYLFTQHLLYGSWRNPNDSFPVSKTFIAGYERLPLLGFGHVHAGIILSLLAVVFCHWLTSYSAYGLMAKAIAANPQAAKALGVPVNRIVIGFAALSGALSGIAGFAQVAGNEYKLTQFVGNDYIFPSIVIAYLGRGTPLGVLVAAVAVAGLYTTGDSLKAFYQIPGSVIVTIEATLLLVVSAFEFFLRYRVQWIAKKTPAGSRP